MSSKIFIGSSVEGKKVAKAVQAELSDIGDPHVWDQGVLLLGRSFLEELVRIAASFDFAVIVATPDDFRLRRAKAGVVPRDNVVFEMGLFLGALGRDRAFLLAPSDAQLELPSDLAGIAIAEYKSEKVPENAAVAVGPACTKIAHAIEARSRGRGQYEEYKKALTDNEVRMLVVLRHKGNTRPSLLFREVFEKRTCDLQELGQFAWRCGHLTELGLVSIVGGSEMEITGEGRAFLELAQVRKESKYLALIDGGST